MGNTVQKANISYHVYTAGFALLCGAVVALGRAGIIPHLFPIGAVAFSSSDFYVLLSAGLCGYQYGLLTFLVIFLSEAAGALLQSVNAENLFTLSVYLGLILLGGYISERRWYKTRWGTFAAAVIFILILGTAWYILAFYLFQGAFDIYSSNDLVEEYLGAVPEALLSQAALYLLFRFLPDGWKTRFGMGYLYTDAYEARLRSTGNAKGRDLGRYVTVVALAEAVLLALTAVLFSNLQLRAIPEGGPLGQEEQIVLAVQMFLLILCVTVPIVIGINSHVQKRLTGPLTRDFLIALSRTVDAKDHYTSGHSQRVAAYAREIARRAGYPPQAQEEIYVMGLLHDIGKIGVSEAIINKQGRLTDGEFAEMKRHPVIGYEILNQIQGLPRLSIGARWHHERYDGRGYPDGLAGEDIPEEARIIGVADAYDAMTSRRSYSQVRPQEQVRAEMVRCAGSQFDPRFAAIMVEMIDGDKKYDMRER